MNTNPTKAFVTMPDGSVALARWDPATGTYSLVADTGEPVRSRPLTDDEQRGFEAAAIAHRIERASLELDRLIALLASPERVEELNELALRERGLVDCSPWREPTGVADAYPAAAVVQHKGCLWVSTIAANIDEPGCDCWLEVEELET